MLRQVTAGLLGIAAIGFALPAGAITSTAPVTVNIHVLPTISMWPNTATVDLTLDGSNPPDNSTAVLSGLNYINNVDAKIDALVTGNLGSIQFHIFDQTTTAAAIAAINANQYNPAGALNWNQATLGTSQQLTPSVGVNTTIHPRPVVYAAGLPGDLPPPATYTVLVTYTMTAPP